MAGLTAALAVTAAVVAFPVAATIQGARHLSLRAAEPPIVSQSPITVNSRQRLVDQYGRERLFHGANVVVKGFPWVPSRGAFDPETSFVAEDMLVMQSLGLNAIRLGAMWPGAEPTQGTYNSSYLQVLADIVAESAEYGIYSLLDMHQDVLADKFCGEGLPEWAAIANVTNFPWPLQSTPYNVTPDGMPNPSNQCDKFGWASYYPTQAVGQAFQNLYSNAFGLRDAWAAFWAQVANEVKGLGAAVLGYELLNEPWAGDAWHDVLLMLPGVADAQNLAPAYDAVAAAIRAVDPLHSIYFEGVTWDWFNVGFKTVPGGDEWKNRSVLSYHFYIPPDFNLDTQMEARVKDLERLGCGGMLTEYGVHACDGCGDIEPVQVMDKCDELLQSWLFWELKPFIGGKTGSGATLFYPNGTLNQTMAQSMARTYAKAVAGTTDSLVFNSSTGAFALSYTVNNEVSSALPVTEIFFSPEYWYVNGQTISIQPANLAATGSIRAAIEPLNRTITVTHDPSAVPVGTQITVSVVPQ
jgi:endoglycosylceramidase